MQLDFAIEFELGDAPKILAQDFFLDFELMLVIGVLVVASTAGTKIWARRRNTMRRRLYDRFGMGSGETGLFLGDRGFDLFSGENERDKYGLAASAVVGGQASQPIAAVDKLFNV